MGKNVTLKLDEIVLRKARHAAVEKDQSLSEWVAGLITSATSQEDRRSTARERALKRLRRGFRLGGEALTREEAYER